MTFLSQYEQTECDTFDTVFDTANHDVLISGLQSKLEVNGTVLYWLESYLSGISQRVYVNGSVSNKFHLDCGVPQGSYLS